MKKTKNISLIFGILIIISCKQNVEKKKELKTENSTELATHLVNELVLEPQLDTLNADNFNLLFFRPSETEFEELLKKYERESGGLYEVDSDFGFYTSKVYDSISKTDLKVKIVTERIIKYSTESGTKYLDRLKNEEHPYGIIFNNSNCNPKIEFGIMTGIGILQELEDYNKNCK